MIVVVDYGAANLLSITRALEACGARVAVSEKPAEIEAAEGVVLPGVGAAGSAMARLRASGADVALRQVAAAGRPLLGICLGMQLFFEELEEDGATGLGLLPGAVKLLPPGNKIPHMGWNTVTWTPDAPGTALFARLQPGIHAYFVHSYVCVPADLARAVAWTDYGVADLPSRSEEDGVAVPPSRSEEDGAALCAAVAAGSLYGVQFHPEKSGAAGLRMLANWLALVTAAQPAQSAQSSQSNQSNQSTQPQPISPPEVRACRP